MTTAMTTYEQPTLFDDDPAPVAPAAGPTPPMTKSQRLAEIRNLYDSLRTWKTGIGLHMDESLKPGTEEGDHATAYRLSRQREIEQQIRDMKGGEA